MYNGLSLIIATHNEPRSFTQECVTQIRETIDVEPYEIIVVDDGSDKPIGIKGAIVVRHPKKRGVGAAFDTGVKEAQYDNIIIMGCDIRFMKNKWASRMLEVINNDPKSIVCANCVALRDSGKPEDMDVSLRAKIKKNSGASLLYYHNKSVDKNKPKSYRSILQAKWLPKGKSKGVAEVPCILGAIYAIKKEWYKHIDGFWGHRQWGCLEPYISLKSWLFGGRCYCHEGVDIGHIFKSGNPHKTDTWMIRYNRLMTAYVLFRGIYRDKLSSYVPDDLKWRKAKSLVAKNINSLESKCSEYQKKIKIPPEKFFAQWKIKS